jgi:uncharacterized membrane protein
MNIIAYAFLAWISLKLLPGWILAIVTGLPHTLANLLADPGAFSPFSVFAVAVIAYIAINAPGDSWDRFKKIAIVVVPMIVLALATHA